MSLISGNTSKIFAKGVIGNVRKAQEDSHGYMLGTPNGDLFVVCDGMGGHVGGATASRLAVDSIIGFISKEKYATPIDALDGALQFANMQILGYADAHPELKGMGTTSCIVLIQNDDVWIAHVGDSRIYLYLGKEHQLHRITKDHSYVQTLVDAGQITDEEAEHHPNKNRILKALGIKPELHPSFNYENRPIHPKNGDIFLICSDGLSGMIPDHTIQSVLGEESLTLQQKGDTLIDRAMEGETICPGGQDNCTVELIEVDNSPWNESEFKSYNPKDVVIEKKTVTQECAPREQHTSEHVAPKPNASTTENNHSQVNLSRPSPKKKLVKIIAITVAALIVIGVAVWKVSSATGDSQDTNSVQIQQDEVESGGDDCAGVGRSPKGMGTKSELSSEENIDDPKALQDSINKWEKQKKEIDKQQKDHPKDRDLFNRLEKEKKELQGKIDEAVKKRQVLKTKEK